MKHQMRREILLLVACSALIYVKALFNGHTYDDHLAIEQNPVVTGKTIPFLTALLTTDFWGRNLSLIESHRSYRPFVTTLYWLEGCLTSHLANSSSPHPGIVRAVSIALHCLSTITFYRYLRRSVVPEVTVAYDIWSCEVSVAFICSLLFALHPIHSEAVCSGVGQAEIACCLFTFLALQAYSTEVYATSQSREAKRFAVFRQMCLPTGFGLPIFAVIASASKEQGFMIFPMCLLLELMLIGSKKFNFQRLLGIVVLMVLSSLARFYLIGPPRSDLFNWIDNPAAFKSFPVRQLTFAYLPTLGILLMVYPWNLLHDWADGTVPLVETWSDMRLIPVALILISIIIKTFLCLIPFLRLAIQRLTKRQSSGRNVDVIFLTAMIISTLTFLPSSNILGIVGFVIAERVLYLPSAGFCLLVAVGFYRLMEYCKTRRRTKQILVLLFVTTCFSFTGRAFMRTFDWNSDLTLSQSALKATNSNSKLFVNIGSYMRLSNLDDHRALAYFEKAVRLNPRVARNSYNRANCLISLIEKTLNGQIKPNKNDPSLEQMARACERSLRHCIAVAKWSAAPNGVQIKEIADCHIDLAVITTIHGNLYLGPLANSKPIIDHAFENLETAKKLQLKNVRSHVIKAHILAAMGRITDAKAELEKARKRDPNNNEATRLLAMLNNPQQQRRNLGS